MNCFDKDLGKYKDTILIHYVEVARVVNIKLGFTDQLFFTLINKVMQNPILKFRQSSFFPEKPSYLSEKLKTLSSSNYHRV